MRVFFQTLGCRLNEAEVAQWRRDLSRTGHEAARSVQDADVLVANTCAVTKEAARKSRKLINRLHRTNPIAKLVVTGCYASLEKDRVADLMGVDLIVANSEKDTLVAQIAEKLAPGTPPRISQDPGAALYGEHRTRAFIKVQDGCRNRCTFCIVTVARGDERSRSVNQLVDEVQGLSLSGSREVVLTGVHLGGYGHDIGTDLITLVERILEDTSVERLRLSSLEPWDLPAGFGGLWRDSRLMPHLHLPLQSGADRTLKRMARRCPTAKYRALVENLRAKIPDLVLTTDLIVGFPGETDSDHRQTMSFVQSLEFGHVHVFPFSPRAGTAAAAFDGQVPEDMKRERTQEAIALADTMRQRVLASAAGQVRQVLWEGPGVDAENRQWGYTDNYLRVETSSTLPIQNQITSTRLVHRDGFLFGDALPS